MAAAIAFHVSFSVLPMAVIGVSVLGLITGGALDAQQQVVDAVVRVVPLSEQGRARLQDVVVGLGDRWGVLGVLGLVGVVWSATGVMAAIRTALNSAWDTDRRRPFLRGKAVDLALVASAFVLVAAALAVMMVIGLLRRSSQHLPAGWAGLATPAVVLLAVLASMALLFLTCMLLFRFVPIVTTRVRTVWPGALVAAVGFEVLQYGLTVYVAHLADYDKVYGALGAVVVFLLFVYLASAVFLFGAEVAAEYPRLPSADYRRQAAKEA